MAEELKIEKGIIPPNRCGGGSKVGSVAVFRAMEEGDSIFFADANTATRFCNANQQAHRNTEWSAMQRKVEGGHRVWKVKRAPTPKSPTS